MSADFEIASPLPGAAFGATLRLAQSLSHKMPAGLPDALAEAGGLLLVPGLGEIADNPRLLLQMSYLFGPEVEDYRYLLTGQNVVHQAVPEIFMVTNMVANFRPPPKRPDPPRVAEAACFGWLLADQRQIAVIASQMVEQPVAEPQLLPQL